MPAQTSRKESILQTLALMLENSPGERITTAALAKEVGVSEAALYRHFPSKAKMFEALIEFMEDALFSRINQISKEPGSLLTACEKILMLVITFASRNPGLCRILTGDALTGEHERLRKRASQVFERLETQLKQLLRQLENSEGKVLSQPASSLANLLTLCVEGKIHQFVRSGFTRNPTEHWNEQWQLLSSELLKESLYPTV